MDHDQYNAPAVSEPVATSPDLSRQAATDDDFISIKEVQQIFEAHGRSVTERTLQRYCENKHMVGTKRLTVEGQKWFVTKSSVYTRLKELDEFDRLRVSRQVATSPDMSASVAHEKQEFFSDDNARQAP